MTEFKNPQDLNYDNFDDARIIRSHAWPLNSDIIVFDEIHKMKGWKRFVKGIYDTRQDRQSILGTGSARLETFRQAGESLAGRYFHFRLNPISVRELKGKRKTLRSACPPQPPRGVPGAFLVRF